MIFLLALAGIFVGMALVLLGYGPFRALGAVLVVAIVVGGVVVTRKGERFRASPEPAAAAGSRPEPDRASVSARAGLPPEVEAMWRDIELGKIRYGAPELESWGRDHPGPVTDTLFSFAALRSGEYDRALGYAERALAAEPRGLTTPMAARGAGEASWGLGRYDDALRHFAVARRNGGADPELDRMIKAASRDARVEKSYTTLASNYFVLKVPGGDEAMAKDLGRVLDSAWESTGTRLGSGPTTRPVASLYAAGDFSEATELPPWVTGLYDGRVRIPVGELAGDRRRLEGTIRHEVAHVFVTHRSRNFAPAWLQEGISQLVEIEAPGYRPPYQAGSAALPPFPASPFPGWLSVRAFDLERFDLARAAYDASRRQVERLRSEKGWEWIGSLLDRLSSGSSIDEAYLAIYGRTLESSAP